MPIYDYVCSACGELTEVIHPIDAPPPRYCPRCGREGTLRKSFAPPAVVFKGSGWAKKDRSTAARASKRPEGKDAAATSKDGGGESGSSTSATESGGSSKGSPSTSSGSSASGASGASAEG